jgi:hypothetical protein
MKKIIFAFVYLLPIVITAQQKPRKYFIYAQGGYLSSLYVNEAMQKKIVSETETHTHKCIILNAGLQWRISRNWRMGPAFTYDHFGTKYRSVEYSALNYLFRCDRIWRETKKSILYSGLSIGVRKLKQFENGILKKHQVDPGYHFYLIGADFKVNKFLIAVNTGYGVSGVFNLGLKYRF